MYSPSEPAACVSGLLSQSSGVPIPAVQNEKVRKRFLHCLLPAVPHGTIHPASGEWPSDAEIGFYKGGCSSEASPLVGFADGDGQQDGYRKIFCLCDFRISGKETGSIIDLRDGSFSFADGGLVYDEGNLVLKDGLIKSANYNKDEETGSMIDLTNGNFSFAGNGLTYDGENQLQVKGDIEANSIYANEAYELWYNGDRRHVLMSTRETSQSLSGIWGLKLKLNNDTYIDLKERTSMDFESVINVHAHNIHLEGNTYSKTGQIISSDKNLKHNIQELDKEKSSQFIYSLKPSKFKYNNGTSDRFHHGFIAQEIKESLGEEDNAVYVEQKDGTKGLRYEEFIADLVATVQMQNERIKVLEEKLDSMK